jgi:hypothetical protein
MVLPVLTCRKFLGLLEQFYEDLPARPALEATLVAAEEVPQPQRKLLVHHRDMTSTLRRHYGEPIALRVLDRKLTRDHYARHIVLETARTGRAVEYGAIRVYLPLLSPQARTDVLAARTPMGAILAAHGVSYHCCPGAYFKLRSNELINQSLGLDDSQWVYGRCNCLDDQQGQTIAEVIEILPPGSGPAAGVRPALTSLKPAPEN